MLNKKILTFDENITGLREFIELIGPFIEQHHQRSLDQHDKIIQAFEDVEKLETETNLEEKQLLEQRIRSAFDGEMIEIVPVKKVEEKEADQGGLKKFVIAVPKSQAPKVDMALGAPRKKTYQKDLLYKNAFIGLLSSVEWFYSEVLHFYYDKFPTAAGVKKKTLSLEELKTFKSVEDAEKYLIDSKIEEIFRGGFDGWVSLLKEDVKLKMPYITSFYDDLIEVYQRRNLLVHNGGIVNSIYFAKTPLSVRNNLKIGDKLDITESYLEHSICKLHTVFTLIAAELWKKLEPEAEQRAEILNSIAYKNMRDGRWEVSEWLAHFIKEDEKLKSRVKTIGQLNYWLSKKRKGEKKIIEDEILAADFSDKSLRYQLAIAGLLEDKNIFFSLLPEVLRTKALEVSELLEYPIFEEMRDTQEFEDFKKNSKEFLEMVELESPSDSNDELTIDERIEELIEDSRMD